MVKFFQRLIKKQRLEHIAHIKMKAPRIESWLNKCTHEIVITIFPEFQVFSSGCVFDFVQCFIRSLTWWNKISFNIMWFSSKIADKALNCLEFRETKVNRSFTFLGTVIVKPFDNSLAIDTSDPQINDFWIFQIIIYNPQSSVTAHQYLG